MRNADMPVVPATVYDREEGEMVEGFGLTKRELMAMHIFSGLLSDPNWTGGPKDAVKLTDLLLEELGRTK